MAPSDGQSDLVPEVTVLEHITPQPPIPKIELESAFMAKSAVAHLQANGEPDWSWFKQENGLCDGHVEFVAPRLQDFEPIRLKAMDQSNVSFCMAAPVDPGVQAFEDPDKARQAAIDTNNYLAGIVAKNPRRFGGWASVSLHDGATAAQELRRAVKELGFHGVMIQGFQQTPDPKKIIYLDDPILIPFWEALVELDVPLYIHPRVSHQRMMYDGYPFMQGAMWGFAPETCTHLLRIVYAGLFDRFPTAQVAVGHMGETLPFMAWRINHYFSYNNFGRSTKLSLHEYLARNIWITTSGQFNTQALQMSIEVMGADRIMFSVDYPFENMSSATEWIDNAPISQNDRRKICHENAARFLKLKPLTN